jgi:hypothetical protein
MAAQSLLAKLGMRSATLGTAASLAIAAPLAEGDYSMAAHTDASRIGWYFERVPTAEKIGMVVMGSEVLRVGVSAVTSIVRVNTPASAAPAAGLNIGQGVNPTAPIDGDIWITSSGAFARVNGVTQQLDNTGYISGTLTAGRVPFASAPTVLTDSNTFTYAAASGLVVNLTGIAPPALPTGTGLNVIVGNANAAVTRAMLGTYMGTGGGFVSYSGRSARGSISAPTAIQNGDEMTHLAAWGYGATGFSSAARAYLTMFAGENWTDTAQGARVGFYTTASGTTTTTEKMRIWGQGGVQIGGTYTASTGAGSLYINGPLTLGASAAGTPAASTANMYYDSTLQQTQIAQNGGAYANLLRVVFALTDAANISVNAALGDLMTVTLGGNRTIAAPTNPVNGQMLMFKLKQDGAGNRTVTWNAIYQFSTDLPTPTLSTAASTSDYIGFIYDSVSVKWNCIAYALGYA